MSRGATRAATCEFVAATTSYGTSRPTSQPTAMTTTAPVTTNRIDRPKLARSASVIASTIPRIGVMSGATIIAPITVAVESAVSSRGHDQRSKNEQHPEAAHTTGSLGSFEEQLIAHACDVRGGDARARRSFLTTTDTALGDPPRSARRTAHVHRPEPRLLSQARIVPFGGPIRPLVPDESCRRPRHSRRGWIAKTQASRREHPHNDGPASHRRRGRIELQSHGVDGFQLFSGLMAVVAGPIILVTGALAPGWSVLITVAGATVLCGRSGRSSRKAGTARRDTAPNLGSRSDLYRRHS